MKRNLTVVIILLLYLLSCKQEKSTGKMQKLSVSGNGHYLVTADGKPFFWLGDTGWLLFGKLDRQEADQYLEDRQKKGFNVIQVMVLHQLSAKNKYGNLALISEDVSRPDTPAANAGKDSAQYSYWEHIDYMISKAEEKGLYMALVPVWGTNVKKGAVSPAQAKHYAEFLARRYRNRPNIIWLNGGDINGSDSIKVWQTIGETLRANDHEHLITFHPRGRTQSSYWFHNASWLDFNMVQSGHRRYDQDTSVKEKLHYGEDNWKYIQSDYDKKPIKPTIDGEPSYEGIPQGLHDIKEPRWTAADVRRYGYWSVFAGAFGYTYGQNSVMQMHQKTDKETAYGSDELWSDALQAPGAAQMVYLKELMLSHAYEKSVPDQQLVAGNKGEKYQRIMVLRGVDNVMAYTYSGRKFLLHMGKISGKELSVSWFNPRNGKTTAAGKVENTGIREFDPPGEEKAGNDWVLILERTD